MLDSIDVRGARQHNLQDINVQIPRRSLTVVTGLSGSGKSSLAFDTIYAEGQRRYVETLSPYARQFLEQLEKPDIDSINGLSPALSIEQKTSSRSPRSTVGTVTEIYDYLRLMFSSVGNPHCVQCNLPIVQQSTDQIVARISEQRSGDDIEILAPCVRGRKGLFRSELDQWARQGFVFARVDGQRKRLDHHPASIRLNRNKAHTIEVVVDRVRVRKGAEKRLRNSIGTASKLADGLVLVIDSDRTETLYSEKLVCVQCGSSLPEFEPRSFSFNSGYGACERCAGLGVGWDLDLSKLILHPNKPFEDVGWPRTRPFRRCVEHALKVAAKAGIDSGSPWRSLSGLDRELMLHGTRDGRRTKIRHFGVRYRGFLGDLRAWFGVRAGYHPRKHQAKFMTKATCRACNGSRLRPTSLAVRVGEYSIAELTSMPMQRLCDVLNGLRLEERKQLVAERLLEEIRQRVAFLRDVGLGYLSLDRPAASLSGGEAQRVRLSTQIGTRLRGVLYVLDEPSIGLHARDHALLLDSLVGLRDLGNTVIVVEHDQASIERADHVVDLGPGAGRLGGEVVASGPPQAIRRSGNSVTGQYLSGRKTAHLPAAVKPPRRYKLVVRGARHNNLKNAVVTFPLGNFCVVAGVSGSGKSSLVNGILYPVLANHTRKNKLAPGDHDRVSGLNRIDKVVRIDQTPIGRTPCSTPATYTGTFTPIRDFFSLLPESRARGYKPGRFSFNVAGGRCDTCMGKGFKRIEMKFLPDVFVKCETCEGRRYNRETLQVRYKGFSIADLLEAPVEQVLEVMEKLPGVEKKLRTLVDVGLGYIELGQSSTTISGGEAQRMKLARELSKRQTGKTVYVLDEPTTGLHFEDVHKLLGVLRRLVDLGNTVIVIEHQLDVIRSADWIVDLGPEGGEEGGEVVCMGSPRQVAAFDGSHTGRALREAGVE